MSPRTSPAPRRRLAGLAYALITALLVTSATTVLTAGAASAQPIVPGDYYQLIAVHSGKAIDVDGASTSAGAAVVQWAPHDGTNQQFRFESSGSGFYRVIARHSGMALDVYEWNPDNGAEIRQWTDLNGTNQQWSIVDRGNNEISLINRFSGKALDVWENSTADGGRLSQFDSTGAANQRFRLVPAGGGTQPPPPPPPPPGNCGSGSYHAEVTQSGSTYTARNGGSTVFSGSNYLGAINAAINSLTPGRSSQQRVVVFASGSIGAAAVNLPSNTSFEVCGTMTAGNSSGNGAVQSINAQNVSVPHLTLRGNPYFGLRFAGQTNLHLGQLDIRLDNSGIGVRFERDLAGSSNVTIDNVFVSGTSSHGVETWHVDGLTIGTITARDTGFAGLLLNQSRNATIGLVDGINTGSGTGYATFRTANRNGRIGDSYPTNIRVGEVRSQGGGRGIFCVSESGGLVIDRISLANNGNNSILVENCYNVTIAAVSGTISGGGELRLAARTEFPTNQDIWIQNLTVTNTGIRESPCGNNTNFINLTRNNAPLNVC